MTPSNVENSELDKTVRIVVDADGTPRDALATVDDLAGAYNFRVLTISTVNHEFHRPGHITVDPHPQAVDMEIIRRLDKSIPTVVITQDYGLAALVLAKGDRAISPRGKIFTDDNIDLFLMERDLNARARRASGRVKGPKARSAEDAAAFRKSLHKVLLEMRNSSD